jgi:hypothetical protein
MIPRVKAAGWSAPAAIVERLVTLTTASHA